MFRSFLVSKIPFVNWLRDLAAEKSWRKPPRRQTRRARLGLELLEDRLAPASFAEVGGVITLSLTANNETITISANAASNYTFATNSPNTFSGSVSGTDATFSGFGASTGTLLTNLTGPGSTTQNGLRSSR